MGRSRGSLVVLDLDGDERLRRVLEAMLRETDDLRPAWKDIYHPATLRGAQDFFATEGDGKWRDLTDRYALYKAQKGIAPRILVGTPPRKRYPRPQPGDLMRSLTTPDSEDHIFDINPRWMRTGTRDKLANIHFAAKGRRKRKPLDAKSPSMQAAFREAVEEHARRYAAQWSKP